MFVFLHIFFNILCRYDSRFNENISVSVLYPKSLKFKDSYFERLASEQNQYKISIQPLHCRSTRQEKDASDDCLYLHLGVFGLVVVSVVGAGRYLKALKSKKMACRSIFGRLVKGQYKPICRHLCWLHFSIAVLREFPGIVFFSAWDSEWLRGMTSNGRMSTWWVMRKMQPRTPWMALSW